MARPCSICSHPKREEIDAALVCGASLRDIARQYATGKDALARHQKHVAGQLAQAETERAAGNQAQGRSLLERLAGLETEARLILEGAKADGDKITSLKALEALRRTMETVAKYSPVSLQLPRVGSAQETAKAMAHVVEAAAQGKITPQEGQALGGLLELNRKAIETSELEQRLARLEAVAGVQN